MVGTAVYVHRLLFRQRTARLPFAPAVLASVASVSLLLALGFAPTVALLLAFTGTPVWELLPKTVRVILHTDAWTGLFVAWLASNPVVFINEMGRRLGPGTFWRWISGRYHHPRREERTFLFMDMAGSTSAAEALGDERFAQMLQECFLDATDAIVTTRAEVVNYVGDEIILAWRLESDAAHEAFRMFTERLQSRSDEYRARFGRAPTFRGAAHRGTAMVVEVGGVRCQLTYLGDAMNTCARLLAHAGESGYRYVASEQAARNLVGAVPIGNVTLRGKEEPVAVFAVG